MRIKRVKILSGLGVLRKKQMWRLKRKSYGYLENVSFLLKISVALKILSSDYRFCSCGKILRAPCVLNENPNFSN